MFDLRTHNIHVLAKMLSPLNRWGTGEEVGHPPDPQTRPGRNELAEHFITSGGIQRVLKEESDSSQTEQSA